MTAAETKLKDILNITYRQIICSGVEVALTITPGFMWHFHNEFMRVMMYFIYN